MTRSSRGRRSGVSTIEHSLVVDRPVAVVWDVWSDVRHLPVLSASTTEVRDAPARLTAVGQSFCQVVRAVGRDFAVRWEVIDVVALERLVIEGSPGFGVRISITEAVQALGANETRLTLTTSYRLPFGPLGRVASTLGVERLATSEAAEVLDGVAALARAASPA